MRDLIVRWLRAMFATVPDVSRASAEPDPSVVYRAREADITISTWMGARLYLYLIEQPPRLRDLRNLLRENGGNGIGTLFIVDKKLLPENGWIGKLESWQEVLAQLNDGFIYTYILTDEGFSLVQLHTSPAPVKDEFRCWIFDDFTVENVTVRQREINGALRGRWRVGDIASAAYKRKMNYERVNQRYHYRTKYTQDIPPNGQRRTGNGAAPADQHQLSKSYALLGVSRDATEKEIKAAFRRQALQVHPDVSALPRQEANERIKQLNAAYEYIKEYHGWA